MNSTIRTLAAAALAALALSPALPGAAAADSGAAVVADPPGAAAGDADAVLGALVGVVEQDREGPPAQAALTAARDWWDLSRDPAPLVRRLEAVLARGLPQGDADEAVRRTLGDRYLRSGDEKARAAVGVDAGYLGDFLVCGPFGVPAQAAVDVAHPPESGIDLEKEMEGRRGPVRWMRYRSLGIGDLVEPLQYLRPTDGTAYALAQVRSEAGRPAVLKVNARGPHKVFVNGAEVLRRDRLRETLPRTAWVPVTLAAGWNRILVKTVGPQGFALKVCDADRGLPLPGLAVEKGMVLHPASPARPAPASVGYRSNLDAVLGREPAGPEERVLRAILAESYDLPWNAWTDLERAAKDAPASPGVLVRFASFVQGFDEMPEPRWRKNRARGIYEDVLERSPGHVPAVIALAEILSGEDKTEDALAGLKPLAAAGEAGEGEAAQAAAATRAAMERSRRLFPGLDALLKEKPALATAWWSRSRMCQERGWAKEAEDTARKAVEANPRLLPALQYLLRIADGYGDAAGTEKACRAILEANRGDSRTARRLAGILRARGDDAGAVDLLRGVIATWPADFDAREELARAFRAARRYDEAAAVYAELETLSPLEETYPRRRGEILRLKGDDAGARKAWERSLALDGGQGPLRRETERLAGAEADLARRWDVDGVALAKECGGQETYPKAVSVHVVDLQVVRVHDDGSWTSVTHDVYKILNEKGREKYSDLSVPGVLLEVRAISPEGEVFLPIGARGGSFTLEGLQGGWIVESRYLNDQRRGERGFDSGGWFFQDPRFGQDADPVVLSRLVVDMPAGMEVPLLLRNYGPPPAPTVEEGRKVYVFEKRDMDRIEEEPRMPDAAEICPSAHFYQRGSWEWLNLEALDGLEAYASTPILEEKAREVTAGVEGRLARAKSLYDFVNREINGNAGGWGPTGVLLEKSGNRFRLFGALLRAAGIPFDLVRVSTGPPEEKNWELLSDELFPDSGLLVRGEDDAAMTDDAFVFNFARHTPFGRIPLRDRGMPAFVPGPAGPTLFRMPTGSDADIETDVRAAVTIGASPADTTFALRLADPGDGWYGFKERIKDMNEDDRRKETARMLERYLPSADLRTYSYPGLEEAGAPFGMEAAGGLPRILREEGGAMVLPLGLEALDATGDYIERPERKYPFLVRGNLVRRDRVEFDLGGRWRVKRLPRSHTAASKIGTYSLVVSEGSGRVRIERRVRFGECRYSPDEYREFVTWCRDLDSAEEQRILLEEAK